MLSVPDTWSVLIIWVLIIDIWGYSWELFLCAVYVFSLIFIYLWQFSVALIFVLILGVYICHHPGAGAGRTHREGKAGRWTRSQDIRNGNIRSSSGSKRYDIAYYGPATLCFSNHTQFAFMSACLPRCVHVSFPLFPEVSTSTFKICCIFLFLILFTITISKIDVTWGMGGDKTTVSVNRQ